MKDNIDFLIACGRNSEEYIQFLIKTVEKTATHSSFRFLLGINDEYVSEEKLKSLKTNHQIEVIDCQTSGGFSYGHGGCLDKLLSKVQTDFFITCDCDVAFLTYGWDKILKDKLLSDDRLAVIGSEYDGSKYMNFPNVIMSMFKTKVIRDCEVSFMPAKNRKIKITESDSHIFSRPVGDVIDLDTGWEVCYKLITNNYAGYALPLRRKSAGDECIFLEGEVRGEEYIFEKTPICSHVGRSYTRKFDHPVALAWKNRVEEWFDGKV